MAVDKVYLNEDALDFGSLTVLFDNDPVNGIKGVKYSEKRERTKQYGTGKSRTPRGRTRGKYSAEGSITVWKDTAEALRKKYGDKNGGSYGNAVFQINVQYYERGGDFINVQLWDCCFAGNDADDQEGNDPLSEEMALDIMRITKNGRSLFDGSGGGIAGIVGAVIEAVESIF